MSTLSSELPPTVSRLEDIYSDNVVDFQRKRYTSVRNAFIKRFGTDPQFFARSPGRVNLIGRTAQIYLLFSRKPELKKIAVSVKQTPAGSPPSITLANTAGDKYPDRTFQHEEDGAVTIDSTIHEWSNYFKCGYKGVFEELGLKSAVSFDCLVDGTVPAGAGTSSSSAFVCCAALATLTANGQTMNKGQLTATAIRSERYAGVQTGG
ncbi:galactokinase, partial [Borealophlyctis nickersoniae]